MLARAAGVLYDRRLTELVGGNMSLRVGDAVVMRVLVALMRVPDLLPPAPPDAPLEPEDDPPWLSPGQAVALLDAWLITEKVEATRPEREQILAILEMPVEAAFGDLEPFGKHFDTQAGDALLGEDLEGLLDPGIAVELYAGFGGCDFHTQQY